MIEKDKFLCPIQNIHYGNGPKLFSTFQSEIYKSQNATYFSDFSTFERRHPNLTMEIFMTYSYVIPGMEDLIFAIHQDPEFKVTTSSKVKKKLWMIYVEDKEGKFNLKKNILLDYF